MRITGRAVGFAVAVAGSVAGLLLALLGVAPSGGHRGHAQAPANTVSVTMWNWGGFNARFCLRTTTTSARPRGSDRSCSGWQMTHSSVSLTADITGGLDEVYLNTEVDPAGGTGGARRSDDRVITGATTCHITGIAADYKIDCSGYGPFTGG
ncbi:hypothetical protein [Krasilnikovia sp. MM14-A1004]|uniref:hypothetical protein n=1 Tax=Krasilnikovia sp. MM14-A1004 TaxID=3373541 RepID=UPI00399CC759